MTRNFLPRRRNLVAALALVPFLPGVARAQQPGTDYTSLDPKLPVESDGKIEVVEFFWYGCPACYKMEPLLDAWVPKLQADTLFRRIPAVFNDRWAVDAAIYYTFEAMGAVEKLHKPFFDSIHEDRLRTDNGPALSQWLQRNGVDLKKFEGMRKSFGVQSKVRRAAQLGAAYRIEGTPTLAVHGRYIIKIEQAQTFERMIAIADHLVGVTRKSLPAAKRS
ncbi:MAG: thiol:disulfide interchange protein DsbA/DsbL [Proteobacteria bacterium]|nr:thiol:disulfide interchange protein DsbA/DsbL [Pseudomonadota bacterium]MDA0981805.1 thiol:disulfide interchange protein DsbA/DsbL [Pseudomonadota bacterium]